MLDSRGRNIEYLRLSVTERCQLSCIYCRDISANPCNPDNELTVGEVGRVSAAMKELGIRKVRLTGGEPLMRRDIAEIAAAVMEHGAPEDLSMTTNGQLLERYAMELRAAGLMRVNVSLDSLDPVKYRAMTGGGDIEKTLRGIDAASAAGLSPIKLNVVTVRDENFSETDALIALAREKPVDVRFIELMPMGDYGRHEEHRVLNSQILALHPELAPIPPRGVGQPSEDYAGEGFLGRVGFISPLSRRFCNTCNRVRVTADARLLPCLGSDIEAPLRPVMEDERALRELIERTIYAKPAGHRFNEGVGGRSMDKIGG